MKWLIIAGFLVYLVRSGDGGVLKCPPGAQESNCSTETITDVSVDVQKENDSSNSDAECLAGTEWDSNCHSCKCSSTGVAECLRRNACDTNAVLEPVRCKVNTTFPKGCSTCVCLENGIGLCTLDHCTARHVLKKEDLIQGKECAPYTAWESQCNSCACSPDGYPLCTEKACVGYENDKFLMRCAPESMWRKDCNRCWCTPSGIGYCTMIGCYSDIYGSDLPEVTQETNLTQVRKISNTTQKIVCEANRMFIKDCNFCWCNEAGTSYFCTRKICVDDIPDEFTGVKAKNATLQRKTRSAQNQEAVKACQPGSEFRLDCNKCLCDNEGSDFSCTRIDCRALNNNNNGGTARAKRDTIQNVNMECTPGTVFDQGCNVCRCTQDGHHATCSLKLCAQNPNNTSEVRQTAPDSDSNFRCNPGEQIRQGCNDCTCAADGKGIFCSLLLCDSENIPN